uniref:Tetrapyrrole biosynthesis glutamyl-tRNA reductase dimerisation domain-containing protein n=1 Tax=Tetraselmis chuii TaxID=63592 RepID=A0A7S1X073_9CHLO
MLVDISVPRNVHPNVGNVSGTELYNVDDLREVVASNMESRGAAVVAAEALIAREVEQFNRRKASLDAVPKIRSLRARASSIQDVQLSKYMGKLENKGVGLSEEQAAMVQQLVHSVVTQMLHEPTTALRDLSDSHSDATTTTIPTPPQTHWLSGQ